MHRRYLKKRFIVKKILHIIASNTEHNFTKDNDFIFNVKLGYANLGDYKLVPTQPTEDRSH